MTHVARERSKVFVGLVDDHPIVRQGLAQLINAQPDLSVVVEASAAPEALAALAAQRVDVLVVDLSLREGSGIDLVRDVSARWPATPILVLSMHEEQLYAERALRAGARGYLMKHEAPEVVIGAIRKVLAGEVHLSSAMSGRLLNRFVTTKPEPGTSLLDRLSDRELEVFQLIGRGLSTRAIAEGLFLSVKTIETHREHIKQKLGLTSASELLRYAIEHAIHGASKP
jgi:DNA-binding NarL/FixJ family response regulator